MNALRPLISSAILVLTAGFAATPLMAQTPANPADWPSVVQVLRVTPSSPNGSYTQTGVVVDKDWVLVAGHAAENLPAGTSLKVLDGTNKIPVTNIEFPISPDPFPFDSNNFNPFQGDLALLRLSTPFSQTPARLPAGTTNLYVGDVGIPVFHKLPPPYPGLVLSTDSGQILANSATQSALSGILGLETAITPEKLGVNMLSVAVHRGPLFVNDSMLGPVLVGIESYAITGGTGIGLTSYPSVFTRITTHLDWINDTIGHVPTTKCPPSWMPTPIVPGLGTVAALTVFNNGSETDLYFGHVPGEVSKFDGTNTSGVASSSFGGFFAAFTPYNDGTGPALYAGGNITATNNIAKWNGTSWSGLKDTGTGVSGVQGDSVYSLVTFDDGNGSALYVGGRFTHAGGKYVNNIARWNGSTWSALEYGLGGSLSRVDALAVFDDGSGKALYAAGTFTETGNLVSVNNIAKWDAVNNVWLPVNGGVNAGIHALKVFNDGTGDALYAGGHFTTAGSVAANRIAKWNGTSWSALGSGVNAAVNAFAVLDDGTGPGLYVGGDFVTAGGLTANHIAKWNGLGWSALDAGTNNNVTSLAVFDDGAGPALYVGGQFSTAGGNAADRIAKWGCSPPPQPCAPGWVPPLTWAYGYGSSFASNGSDLYIGMYDGVHQWNGTTTTNVGGLQGSVWALTFFGGELYAGGGDLATTSGPLGSQVAKWNGSTWTGLGSGLVFVNALTVFQGEVYAGHGYDAVGGVSRWSSGSWLPVGGPTNGAVHALTVHAGALYAGGSFSQFGTVPANKIAKWDGSNWSALGSGLGTGSSGSVYSAVKSLTVFNGAVHAGYEDASFLGGNGGGIAMWDTMNWTPLDTGGDGTCLTVFDDGTGGGPALYSGGLSKWTGSNWSAIAGGPPYNVMAMTAHDDGNGPAIYVGGEIGGSHLYKWKGCASTAPLVAFGTGTPGGNGLQTLGTNQIPKINTTTFAFTCDNAPPSSLGLMLDTNVQDAAGSDPFGINVLLHVNLLTASEVYTFDIVSDASGNAMTAPIPIPNNPVLIGAKYYAQALWVWPSSYSLPPFNLSTSKAIAMTVQP